MGLGCHHGIDHLLKSGLSGGLRVGDSESKGSELRLRVLGFIIQRIFRVQSTGFRIQGSGFRVQGSGFRAQS